MHTVSSSMDVDRVCSHNMQHVSGPRSPIHRELPTECAACVAAVQRLLDMILHAQQDLLTMDVDDPTETMPPFVLPPPPENAGSATASGLAAQVLQIQPRANS